MKNWIELCSDVNWEDYHGMWARQAKDGKWYILQWTNMWDACGEDECKRDGQDQYHCEVKMLNLAALGAEKMNSALQCCGYEATTTAIVNEYDGDILSDDPKIMERIVVECCIQYGLGAPLESFSGDKRPTWIRAEARRYAEQCMKDSNLLEKRLERPVNRIGSTAREYGLGDTNSALLRGDSPTHQLMRKIQGIPEPTVEMGTLQPNGELTNVRHIKHADIRACQFTIVAPEHYRKNGSCLCDDPVHRQMMIKEWGYNAKDFK